MKIILKLQQIELINNYYYLCNVHNFNCLRGSVTASLFLFIFVRMEAIYKQHKKWVNIVKNLGGGDFSEDIVQEMYIKLIKIELKKQTEDTFVYYILRNMTYDLHRKQSKVCKIDLDELRYLCAEGSDQKDELEKIHQKIEQEEESWHWYDEMLWKLYKDGRSMRELSNETKDKFKLNISHYQNL
jgi:Glu-tRNA(Gln) amidotransferase subunit E-like FAD-binding protein